MSDNCEPTLDPDFDWELALEPHDDYWANRRPYLVSNDRVWIGEPGTHHDTAPPEIRGSDSSIGEIYDDQINPYNNDDPKHKSLVERAWHNHPARSQN